MRRSLLFAEIVAPSLIEALAVLRPLLNGVQNVVALLIAIAIDIVHINEIGDLIHCHFSEFVI